MINLIRTIRDDFGMVFERDPAARSKLEIVLCYAGLHALVMHRLAHAMWNHHMKLFGRVLSHFARWITGIEIHPGATIGGRFFIDARGRPQSTTLLDARTRQLAARLQGLVRLFRDRHGRWPRTLDELVEQDLLASVYRHPYADGAWRYDPATGTVE